MSADPKTKFDRERYIRVAAIDIAISEGNWNICVVEGHEPEGLSHEVINKNVRGSTNLMLEIVFSSASFIDILERKQRYRSDSK
jgi:hypothetical protein